MMSVMDWLRCFATGLRLLRSPGEFPAMVVALATGVGLTVAAYSLIYSVLLKPLPYSQPGRLVQVWEITSERTGTRLLSEASRDSLTAEPSPFQDIASYDTTRRDLLRGPGMAPVELLGSHVSANLFNVLRSQAATGRTLQPDDGQLTNISSLVVADRLVRSGLVSGRVGDTVDLDGTPFRLVGTMPDSFWFPDRQTSYWVPILEVPRKQLGTGTVTRVSPTIARLAPGITPVSAQAQANVRLPRPGGQPGRATVKVESYPSLQTAPVRPSLIVLQAASGLVLMLVCLNVGWLFSARGRRLRQTLATIRALGATTGQALITHLAPAVCVAVVAAPCAMLIAWGLLQLSLTLESGVFSQTAAPAITWHVTTVAFVTTVLATVASCLSGAVIRWNGSLNDRSRAASRGRRLFERSLMMVQVSLVFALGAQAILVALVLQSLVRTNVGFTETDFLVTSIEPRGAATVDPNVQLARYTSLLEQLERRGIRAAAANIFPFTESDLHTTFEPRRSREHIRTKVRLRVVTPSYFRVTGMMATRGRLLTDGDEGSHLVVVNDAFVSSMLPDRDEIGRRVGQEYEWTVTGVTSPVRQHTVDEETHAEAYVLYEDFLELLPTMAQRAIRGTYILAETTPSVLATIQVIRTAVAELLPEFTIRSAAPFEDLINSKMGTNRLVVAGSVVFASVSLLLVTLGLYAMVSQGLALRGREIGVRLALGATMSRIALDSARPIGAVYAVGVSVGTVWLLFAMSAIRSVTVLPPGTQYPPVWVIVATSATVLLVTFAAACYRPIRSATRVDAAVLLRTD